MDKNFWKYLEELPEQKSAWYDWNRHLPGWHCFNTFYTYYLKVKEKHAKFLGCTAPCEYSCPRQIEENTPYDITANKTEPIPLKFKDILIYSLRYEDFHRAICTSLQIEQHLNKLSECRNAWYLGEHSGTAVYLTYWMTELTETISLLCQWSQEPFALMTPTMRSITPQVQQITANNKSILLSMEAELSLQSDGSFKAVRSISEYMNSAIKAK